MKTPFDRLLQGFFVPIVGMRTIFSSKKVFILSIVPFLIGLAFIFIGFFVASEYLIPFLENWFQVDAFVGNSKLLVKILSTFMMVLYWLAIAVFNFLFGYICIIIIAGPFYALLAEEIFRLEGFMKPKKGSVGLMLKMVFLGLVKVGLFSVMGLFCFFLAFVPVVNILSPVIIFALVAFDCADYSFEVDLLSLRRRFAFFIRNGLEFAGLTAAIFLTTLAPGSFFVLLPAFVCGATKMYIQLKNKAV